MAKTSPSNPPLRVSREIPTYIWVGLIVLITFIIYSPTLRNGFVRDDFQDVVDNELLHSVQGLGDLWTAHWRDYPLQYYPLTFTAFWMEYHLWGLQPLGYHVVNVLLHIVNAILVGVLLTRLSVSRAWLMALMFAIHPVNVESVAWITELKNVLSGLFFLLAFLAYWRFWGCSTRRWWFYTLALGFYLCALLSKTAIVPLPAVLLLVLWWKGEKINRRALTSLAPFFLLGSALGLLTVHFERAASNMQISEWHLSLIERGLLAGRAFWFYAGKIIWPHPVMVIYPRWEISAAVWWQYLFPLLALGAIVALWWQRGRLGNAPLVAVASSAIMLAPVLGFLTIGGMYYSFVADHWLYLGSIGFIALAIACVARLVRQATTRTLTAAIIIAVLCVWAWQHCAAFRSQKTLYEEEVALNPRSWSAYYDLGNAYLREGNLPVAIKHYQQALLLRPDYEEAHSNLGFALQQSGDITGAITHLKRALQINPASAEAYHNLGMVLLQSSQVEEATKDFQQAVRLKPDFAAAHYMLAIALAKQGRLDEAISHAQAALQLQPDSEQFHQALEELQQFKSHSATR